MAEPEAPRSRLTPRRVLFATLFSAAVAIAITFWVSNAGLLSSTNCAPQPLKAQIVDAAATGQLAGLYGTGTGRSLLDLKFLDPDGKPISVGAFAGKKLLVNFWASWCVPCRAEMPGLNELAAKYNSDEFMVLPVNTGETQEGKAAAFLTDNGWSHLPLYVDTDFSAINRLKVMGVTTGLPTSVLIDEKGCEIGILPGAAEWNTTDGHRVIEALLGA